MTSEDVTLLDYIIGLRIGHKTTLTEQRIVEQKLRYKW